MNADQKPRRLLLPIDGSKRSLDTVRYVTQIKPFHQMHVVLRHVFSGVPEAYWDLEKAPKSVKTVPYVRAWQSEQRRRMQEYMQKARQILLQAGFRDDAVEVRLQDRKKDIAHDIVREAHEGYHAVIARRRGMTALRGIVLGGVATRLLEKLTFVPLILAGRKPPGHKILVAFDGSAGAMQAVEFVGSTLGGADFELGLIHVIRTGAETEAANTKFFLPQEFTDSTTKVMMAGFDRAKARLAQYGFQPDHIATKITTGVRSRAGAITQEAEQQGYGTIVLGRRGLSRVREFFIGRVTNKVVHMARDRTVWIVR
ncbi:MAG: universal stress protein [Desulfobacterales bacterium]|nr:MAG: universal stress protein [Desulfobacterales bacterium]